eukprot:CAMPEP_0202881776 /NCGR_PEP_ID=MMETSP1391-20130828/37056_1 /ASSEMBLY_ACC=CAM_ASM_000867 /TAXON_ID=1034604 /ORGANISM="Chlamydomonas leiostraca, Strain SAG 11-49" /LENGTH=50 /DNA_ID=CAMNT_0049564507 /DNA_START=20 /DNA_END=168 /DNA_ORIENTATION=+
MLGAAAGEEAVTSGNGVMDGAFISEPPEHVGGAKAAEAAVDGTSHLLLLL